MEETQYLCINEEITGLRLTNNETIVTCEMHKFLGMNFNKQGTGDAEIKSRISKGR